MSKAVPEYQTQLLSHWVAKTWGVMKQRKRAAICLTERIDYDTSEQPWLVAVLVPYLRSLGLEVRVDNNTILVSLPVPAPAPAKDKD